MFDLAGDGSVRERERAEGAGAATERGYGARSRFETRNSGGKANAIEVFPFSSRSGSSAGADGRDWVVLTDDEQGFVSVLEWRDEWDELREVASVRLGVGAPLEGDGAGEVDEDERGTGASHAVWLS